MQDRLIELYAKANPKKEKITFSEEYLYRKLYLPAQRADRDVLKLRPTQLNNIAEALGYKNYAHFVSVSNPMSNPIIKSALGNWYSYVRCNSGQPFVLRAPVRIFEERREVLMEMKGRNRNFHGRVGAVGECLRCGLKSENKIISLVLKAGIAEQPRVLQGVFSGLSTAGDPIAGKEILIRQDAEYEDLRNERIPINELITSSQSESRLVGSYFYSKEGNIIKGGRASTFGLDDLSIE
jgi:hypothetical protein